MARANTNYLNNKDLLIEIHKSKNTYCEYEDPKFSYFDAIIYDLDVLSDDDVCTNYFALPHFSHKSEYCSFALQYGHVPTTYLSGRNFLSLLQ